MEIIQSLPRYSDGEINRAFLAEIKSGFKLERETQEARELISRKETHEDRGKVHPVLGRCVAKIPAREFFRLTKKYGHDEVHSDKFVKYFNNKHPELSPNRI